MKSYYPRFRAGAAPGLVAKLGGLPWGLPADLWPICRECGRPMSHLAQLPADPPILPLAENEVLFIFKCEWDSICSFWESDGGANAVFTVPRQRLDDAPTAPPPVTGNEPAPGARQAAARITPSPLLEENEQIPVLQELGLTRWIEGDDGVPAELEDAFYDYDRHNALPDEVAYPPDFDSALCTKAGGVPVWTPATGAQFIPPGRLLLQIDTWIRLEDGSDVEVANFCSDGIAYIFIDRTQSPPSYAMRINR